jgi:hypothetical protein
MSRTESQRYQLLPPLSDEDYYRLKDDIARRGVMVPVEVDENGAVIDGHHRKQIADSLGIKYRTIVRKGMSESEKRLHAVSLNLARRHLTDAQKVMLGKEIEPDVAAWARRRQEELGRAHGDPSATNGAKGRTVDEVAKAVGLGSGRTYERHKEVLAEVEIAVPEMLPRLRSGEKTMKDARRELRPNTPADSGRVSININDPEAIARTLRERMSPGNLAKLVTLLTDTSSNHEKTVVRLDRSKYEIGPGPSRESRIDQAMQIVKQG